MAVLKDLIVHGPSRFISAVGFTDLTANKIEADTVKAENGYFTKLKAKTATMDSVVVNELLDVHGELHTKSWSNSNIATVDGNFHIVPTITAATATGTITYSSSTYSMDVTGAFATNTLTVGNSTSVVAWTPGSSLIVSGEVQINNEWLPLGTLKCDLGGSSNLATDATSKKIPLSNIKDSNGQVSGVLEIIREALNLSGTSSTLNFRNVKIAFYSRKNTKMYPIGILLTAQGTGSSKTFIDMYNGNNESSSTYGGLAMPVVRIGNLSGNTSVANNQPLPAVGGQTPTGWGIYTSNGYFSGTIAAEKGKIANFTINGTKLYSNGHSAYNTSVTGIYIGDDYISFGSGGVTYFNTSGTGKIGPWTLTTTAFYNAKSSYNNSNAGVYIGKDYIAGGAGEKWWFKSDGSAKIGAMTLTSNGVLSVPAANISDKLTASQINVSTLSAITANMGTLTAGIITTNSSRTTYNATTSGLTLTMSGIGAGNGSSNTFYVNTSGTLYASDATIIGKITANSGYIGGTSGWTIASQQLYSGTIGTDNSLHLGAKNLGSNTSIAGRSGSDWRLTVGSKFGVTNTGTFYASAGAIGSNVTIGGTAASTVLTNIANAATTATTYITDIDSNSGIIIKAVNGETSGSDTTKQNYIKLNTDGLEIYQEGASVAYYGDYARVGKDGEANTTISPNEVLISASDNINALRITPDGNTQTITTSIHIGKTIYPDKSFTRTHPATGVSGTTLKYRIYSPVYNRYSIFTITKGQSKAKTTVNVSANFRFQYSATTTKTTVTNIGATKIRLESISYTSTTTSPLTEVGGVLALGQYPSIGTYDVLNVGDGSSSSTSSSFSVTKSGLVSCRSLTIQENDIPIYLTTTDGWEIDALSADASNNLILGRGWWMQNTSGYNTYIEGYETNLWGRNKIATNIAITQGSDKRLKKDIKNLEDVKDFVMDLKPVEFKYEFASDKDKHLGFIAQDVEKSMDTYGLPSDKYGLITEITGTDNIQYKGLNYTEFIPMCIKMIQEQQQEIDALKEALNEILGN